MRQAERVVDQMERAFRGSPWYGPPVARVLAGITAANASARPIAGAHSIWELVLHMTGWKVEALARLQGGSAGDPPAGDWPAAGTGDAAWREAVAALEVAHDRLVGAVRRAADALLDERVRDQRASPPTGEVATQWQTLIGVVQHDVYHLGQIALLKKALGLTP